MGFLHGRVVAKSFLPCRSSDWSSLLKKTFGCATKRGKLVVFWVWDLLLVVLGYLRVYSIRFTCSVSNKPTNKGSGFESYRDPSTSPKSSQPSFAFEPRYLRTITWMSGLRLANWKRWFPESSLMRFSKLLVHINVYLLMLSWLTTLLGKPPVRWKSSIKKNIM